MPQLRPIPGIVFNRNGQADISSKIAPPYDVLTAESKGKLVDRDPHNIVVIDLPHLPAKTVGPDEAYSGAGERFSQWLSEGVLERPDKRALYVYQQTYTVGGTTYNRRGIIGNVATRPFGPGTDGFGGIFPHEQTFSAAKEDRLKLMRATTAQLSPIFGLYSDPDNSIGEMLAGVIESREADFFGITPADGVRHDVWIVDDQAGIDAFTQKLAPSDIFIADGHHRYNTALNYHKEVGAKDGDLADSCLFVLIAMQDPGMIVLPTHRVLGNMKGLTLEAFAEKAADYLDIKPFAGSDVAALEAALPKAGTHAMGLYIPGESGPKLAIATTKSADPIGEQLGGELAAKCDAFRQLDVAILQHVIVEQVCEKHFTPAGENVVWKFPHELSQFEKDANADGFQLGVVMQATPLDAVRQVSEAGELMPQKSTFFYPKLATGLVINPLA